MAQFRRVEQAQHGFRHGIGCLVRHEQAGNFVFDLLESAVVGRGNDGKARGAGFGDDMGHSLTFRKPGEDVHGSQNGGYVASVAEETKGVLQTVLQRQQLEAFSIFGHEGIGTANDNESHIEALTVNDGGGGDEILDALLPVQTPHPADKKRICPDRQFSADALPIAGSEFGKVDHRGDFKRILLASGHFAGCRIAN